MNGPLCRHCQTKPVSRADRPHRRYRVVDGVPWRDFCSKACSLSALEVKRDVRNRAAFVTRISQQLTAEAHACVEGGKVSIHALIRFAWQCEKRGYARGYAAAWAQRHSRRTTDKVKAA